MDSDGGTVAAAGAETKEFQPVADLGKVVAAADFSFHVGGETLIDLHHPGAVATDEVVVVTVIPLGKQFKSGHAVAEVEPADEAHFLQGVQVAINRGQVAALPAQGSVDFLVAERMLMPAQDIQDGLAWGGDFPGTLTEAFGQLGQGLLNEPVGMLMLSAGLVHAVRVRNWRNWRIWATGKETTNKVAQAKTMLGPHGRSNW